MRRPGIPSLLSALALLSTGLASAAFTVAAGRTLGAGWPAMGFTSAAFTATETLAVGVAGLAWAIAAGLTGVWAMACDLASGAWAGNTGTVAAATGLGASALT